MEIAPAYVIFGCSAIALPLLAGGAHYWLSGRFPTHKDLERELKVRDEHIDTLREQVDRAEAANEAGLKSLQGKIEHLSNTESSHHEAVRKRLHEVSEAVNSQVLGLTKEVATLGGALHAFIAWTQGDKKPN